VRLHDGVGTSTVARLRAEPDGELLVRGLSSDDDSTSAGIGDTGRQEQAQRAAAEDCHRLPRRDPGGAHSPQAAGERPDERRHGRGEPNRNVEEVGRSDLRRDEKEPAATTRRPSR
jgi:hypothetical protein